MRRVAVLLDEFLGEVSFPNCLVAGAAAGESEAFFAAPDARLNSLTRRSPDLIQMVQEVG